MKKPKILVVANWKMSPESRAAAKAIFALGNRVAKRLSRIALVMCPPALFFGLFKKPSARNISLGVQDVFWEEDGPHTGENSPQAAKESGAAFAIAGHSERRALGETDAEVAKKIAAAVRAGLTAILCVGEASRDASGAYFEFLKNQLRASLAGLRASDLKSLAVAYEPLWAIGKSYKDAMEPRAVHETSLFIRKVLTDMFGSAAAFRVPILYGGSVDFENAPGIVSGGAVAGILVGRQSLDAEGFPKLLKALNEL